MLAYAPAALFFLLCGIGVLRDRRRFSNAVLLGIAVSLLAVLTTSVVDSGRA
ncbi:hypothetical protein [Kitasatospora cathayae]|uniref:hypothetical protein n=1 Tax=Kitasatospora cathayae TaxID=3004092 RepID=UPI00386019BF